MDGKMLRVMIADDHGLIREGLKMVLERGGLEVVGEASTGRQAVEMVISLEPDVVILDVVMPDMDGLQALAAIKAARPTSCIIMNTAYRRPEYLARAISLGASGFLMKDSPPESLSHVIRTVVQGDAIVSPEILRAALRALSDSTHTASGTDGSGGPTLTPQELRILTLMAEGLSNAEIAEILCVSTNTVKTHVRNLLTKFGASDRTQAVVWAMRKGLVS